LVAFDRNYSIMSKKEKLLRKLFAVPPPKTFTWEELIAVMMQAGFTHECKGGSHYTFEHETGLRVVISKTHPSGILKPYQIKAVKQALETTGAFGRIN